MVVSEIIDKQTRAVGFLARLCHWPIIIIIPALVEDSYAANRLCPKRIAQRYELVSERLRFRPLGRARGSIDLERDPARYLRLQLR